MCSQSVIEKGINKLSIKKELAILHSNSVVTTLLESVSGLLTVLNSKREIVVINQNFNDLLGVTDAESFVGHRLGEVLYCIHSHEQGGCGENAACATCGANLAIRSALGNNASENDCVMSIKKKQKESDVVFKIKSHPLEVDGHNFVLLFLQDITINQTRAALENTFFHDFNNILSSLSGAMELIDHVDTNDSLKKVIKNSVQQLQKEMEIQKYIFQNDLSEMKIKREIMTIDKLKYQLDTVFETHPRRGNKKVEIINTNSNFSFDSDINLINKVAVNMILNALEASTEEQTVTVNISNKLDNLLIEVHNESTIPPEIQVRIFQKNFSTKANEGRGLGTFSMKVFGEKVLGGSISFDSNEENGTTFRLLLPV